MGIATLSIDELLSDKAIEILRNNEQLLDKLDPAVLIGERLKLWPEEVIDPLAREGANIICDVVILAKGEDAIRENTVELVIPYTFKQYRYRLDGYYAPLFSCPPSLAVNVRV